MRIKSVPRTRTATARYPALDASRRALARGAPLVRFGLFAVGVSLFLDQVRPLVSDAQLTWGERRVMGIVGLITLGSFGLGGWVLGTLLKAGADLIDVFVDAADAAACSAALIESQLVPSLNRVAAALEKQGNPSAVSVADELLAARLDAARAADDLDRVIDCRDALTLHLRGSALDKLDRRVARWLASRIEARAVLGPITPELARLARRAGESFGDLPEGAALLALAHAAETAASASASASATTTTRRPSPRPGPTPGGVIPRGQP